MGSITIQRGLPTIPVDRLIVPGTEPATTITNVSLTTVLMGGGIPPIAIISLKDALALIPGSSILLMENFGSAPTTQRLFLLPEADVNCPLGCQPDWYAILRAAATQATEDDIRELAEAGCDVIDIWSKLNGS